MSAGRRSLGLLVESAGFSRSPQGLGAGPPLKGEEREKYYSVVRVVRVCLVTRESPLLVRGLWKLWLAFPGHNCTLSSILCQITRPIFGLGELRLDEQEENAQGGHVFDPE